MGGATALLAVVAIAGCDYGPDGDQDVIGIAGSDTTQDVMEGLTDLYDADTEYNNDTNTPEDDRDRLFNILSQQPTALTVPGDEHCGTRTYHTPPGAGEVAPPNGSSAGRDALRQSVLAGDGCVDIARSSGQPRAVGTGSGQDLASFEYYAFALDALGWSSASSLAPSNLTHAQLQGIYNCTFTNWNQVGGGNGPIQRYWPQAGSGTRQFAQSDLIGFDPTTFSGPNCPAAIITQENSGELIATNGHQQSAIVPYSGANWVAQSRGTAPEQRAGQTIRNLNGQNIVRTEGGVSSLNARDEAHPTAPVAEENVRLVDSTPDYPAIRFVFNVVDNTSVSYQSALRYVGFDNVTDGASSPLCGASRNTPAVIENYGFGRLTNATGPRNMAATHCRKYNP